MRDVGGREPLRPEIDGLYDAFQHSRARRVELPLLSPAEARVYVAEVREKALDTLDTSPLRGRRLLDQGFAFGMIVQHEQQHDETMLATHQLRAGAPAAGPRSHRSARAASLVPAGRSRWAGHRAVALGNERPAHVVDLPAYGSTPSGDERRVRGVRRRLRTTTRGGGASAAGRTSRGRAGRAAVLDARRRHVVAAPVRRARAGGRTSGVPCASSRRRRRAWAAMAPARPSGRRRRRRPGDGPVAAFPGATTTRRPTREPRARHLRPRRWAPTGRASPLVHQLVGDVWE